MLFRSRWRGPLISRPNCTYTPQYIDILRCWVDELRCVGAVWSGNERSTPTRAVEGVTLLDTKKALELGAQIQQLQSLMIAFVTDGRTTEQPAAYKQLYADVHSGR